MKYNIDLNDNDYIEFNYSYLKHSKIGKYSLLATRISFPIAMFVFVLALLIIKIEIGLVISVAAVAVLSTVLWWFIVPVLMRRNIKKDIMKMKSDGKLLYHEKASVEFLDDRIVETCEQGETVVKYSDIVNVYERKVISTYFTVQCRHLYCLRDVLGTMKSGRLRINCHNQV